MTEDRSISISIHENKYHYYLLNYNMRRQLRDTFHKDESSISGLFNSHEAHQNAGCLTSMLIVKVVSPRKIDVHRCLDTPDTGSEYLSEQGVFV